MDIYGIGIALKAQAEIYFRTARRSGRSTLMLNSMKDGDVAVFHTNKDAEWFKREAELKGKKIKCVVADHLQDLGRYPRQVLDHRLVERIYEDKLAEAERMITQLQGSLHVEEEAVPDFPRWRQL